MPRRWLFPVLVPVAFCAGFALAQTTAASGRIPQFENAEVKVWKSVVLPHDPLPMHRHEHPRIIVALRGGPMEIWQASGEHEPHPWESGRAYWLPTSPPGTQHQDVNVGDHPIEVMVIELKTAS